MTSFIFGVLLTLSGLIALAITAFRRGWLKDLSQRFLDGEQNRSRKRINRHISDARAIRQNLHTLFERLQEVDSIRVDLARLTYSETQNCAGELAAIGADLLEVARLFDSACLTIAKRVAPEGTTYAQVTRLQQPAQEPAAASSQPKRVTRKFKERSIYAVASDETGGEWQQVMGKALNDLLERGLIDGVDFFVSPPDLLG